MPRLKDDRLIPENFILSTLSIEPMSPAECHRAYRQFVSEVNTTRPKSSRHRGMRYASMIRYFNLLEQDGKIKRVGMKPIRSDLAHLRRFGEDGAEEAIQVIYSIA